MPSRPGMRTSAVTRGLTRVLTSALTMGAALLAMTVANVAHAEPSMPRALDLSSLVDHGFRLVTSRPNRTRDNAQRDAPRDNRAATIAEQEAMFPSRDVAARDMTPDPLGSATYGLGYPRRVAPRLNTDNDYDDTALPKTPLAPSLRPSLIARDWKGGMSLVGPGMIPTDHVRLSRSMRMLVGRLTMGDGPVVPFFHIGMGEWRYDPEVLPYLPRNQEFAAQFAMGFRVRIAERAALAWEADYTVLCREKREPQNLPTPFVLTSFAVLQVGF